MRKDTDMLRTPVLILIGLVFGSQIVRATSPQEVCKKYLDAQSAVAECLDSVWQSECADCCVHWHSSLNWSICLTDNGETGNKCSPLVLKKYFSYKVGNCNGDDCVYSSFQKCEPPGLYDHYKLDYGLQACE